MAETSTAIFVAGLAVAFFATRYYINSRPSQSDRSNEADRSTKAHVPRQVTENMVDIVSVIVPHLSRDEIRADLEETRSVELTTNRLLARISTNSPACATTESATTTSRPSNWVENRALREQELKRQRQAMIQKARQRAMEMGNL